MRWAQACRRLARRRANGSGLLKTRISASYRSASGQAEKKVGGPSRRAPFDRLRVALSGLLSHPPAPR